MLIAQSRARQRVIGSTSASSPRTPQLSPGLAIDGKKSDVTSARLSGAQRPALSPGRARAPSVFQTYAGEISRYPTLTADQECELGRAIVKDGCAASRRTLIESNLRLVMLFAKKYVNRGLGLEDLIEEGNVGLMRAADGFDPTRGVRFSTYAVWWIKQAMRRAIMNNAHAVHIPRYVIELIYRLKTVSRSLERKLGRVASNDELSEALHLPPRTLSTVQQAAEVFNSVTATRFGSIGDELSLAEVLTDKVRERPGTAMLAAEDRELLGCLLSQISDRDAEVLQLRFGLGRGEPLTLKQIADKLRVSRERVRQISDEALDRLHRLWFDDGPRSKPSGRRLEAAPR